MAEPGRGDAAGQSAPPEERPRRGRGAMALLSAYYGIEGAGSSEDKNGTTDPGASRGCPMDRPDFDAKAHFEGIVATGEVRDVIRSANEVDSEVRDLDGDMQMVVYENYSKFIRATDVTKQVKVSVEGLEPDLKSLQNRFIKITEYQHKVEDAVSVRAREVEALLKQQRICKKMQVLFDLPQTLQRYLDQGAYGHAVEAYSSCAPFLRQHKNIKTFQTVLDDVDLQMGRIRSALQQRLRSAELPVDEAANSSLTLFDLGENRAQVIRDYLSGRAATLRRSLDRCFQAAAGAKEADDAVYASLLEDACASAAKQCVPVLSDAVEGFEKMQKAVDAAIDGKSSEDVISDFVSARLQDLFERIACTIDLRCPSLEVVLSCVNSVRDSVWHPSARRLQDSLPSLLTQLFCAFLSSTALTALKARFKQAGSSIASELVTLHAECKHLQDAKGAGIDSLLEAVAKTEQSLMKHCFVAVGDCQSLIELVGSDRTAGQQLVRGLHEQMVVLLSCFANICWAYIGHEPKMEPTYSIAACSLIAVLKGVDELEWNGLFGLSLVWIGRRWDEKLVSKAWSKAKVLCAGGELQSELGTDSAVAKVTQTATEAVIAHYVLIGGQRLAHFLRNSMRNRNWMTAKEPQEPSLVVEMVFREVHSFDAHLARIFGDPRKPRGTSHRRAYNSINRTSMELELERMMAKKLQAFAPIPFSRKGAVAGILRIAFKALYEYVRDETFAKFGLQQIQVDTDLLAELARDFVDAEDAGTLGSLLGEVVNSATQRCVEPVLMDATAVESLCDKKKKTLRFE